MFVCRGEAHRRIQGKGEGEKGVNRVGIGAGGTSFNEGKARNDASVWQNIVHDIEADMKLMLVFYKVTNTEALPPVKLDALACINASNVFMCTNFLHMIVKYELRA